MDYNIFFCAATATLGCAIVRGVCCHCLVADLLLPIRLGMGGHGGEIERASADELKVAHVNTQGRERTRAVSAAGI